MKNNLKKFRLAADLTQEQLAKACNTTKQYICQYETGVKPLPSMRQELMSKICTTLGCQQIELLTDADFEFDDEGLLIVDGIYFDTLPINGIIKIKDDLYIAPAFSIYASRNRGQSIADMLTPYLGNLSKKAIEFDWAYPLLGCTPRKNFDLPLGRAITAKELDKLKAELKLTDNDISDVFEDSIGKFFGKRAIKTFPAVQIKVKGNTIKIENMLTDMGIQACALPGVVNVRVG